MDKAKVAQSTLLKVSQGWEPLPSRPRKKGVKNPVTKVKVDQRVWKKARELANNDNRRLEVVNTTTVIVHNPGWRKL